MRVFTVATPRCTVRVVEGFCLARTHALVQRGLLAAERLRKATDNLTDSLAEAACIFQEHFGDRVEALVTLEIPNRERPRWSRLVGLRYAHGNIYVEYREPDRISQVLLIDASREARMAASTRLSALYVACGGVMPIVGYDKAQAS